MTKAQLFRELHHSGTMLVLPNIWDPLGAALLEDAGYPAIATASASVAFTHGYDDGEIMPFDEMLGLLKRITYSVQIPVTADIESGYADTVAKLEENIKRLIETGIVGINIEDYDPQSKTLFSLESQTRRISLIRNVSKEMGIPLFINARTDIYIKGGGLSKEQQFEETVKRGKAYLLAGADGFYPIAMKEEEEIRRLVTVLSCPVNILTMPGIPPLKMLRDAGVARVSLGPSFLKIAIRSLKAVAQKLQQGEGLEEITSNEITTDYLKRLVTRG